MSYILNENFGISMRDPESYPDKLKFVLDLITFNEIPRVVGSYAYTTHKYPSDVDVFERVIVNLNAEEAGVFYESQFKIIFEKLLINSTKIFINDFKAGEDRILSSIYKNPELSLGNNNIREQLRRLLDTNAMNKLYSTTNDKIFKDNLRRYVPLRWKPEEILLGQKKTISGEIVLLRDALRQQAFVKLDVITWIRDRFQSIEVLYNLNYTESNQNSNNPNNNNLNGNYQINNLNNNTPDNQINNNTNINNPTIRSFLPLNEYRKFLLDDINKFSSPEFYAPLKAAKRIWSLSRIDNCTDLLQLLNPLMESNAAALNQIKSEIEVLTDVIEMRPGKFSILKLLDYKFNGAIFNDAVSLNKITNQLFTQMLNFSKRLSNHLDLEKYTAIKNLFTDLFNEWMVYNNIGKFNKEEVKLILDDITDIISTEIIVESKEYLETVNQLNLQCGTKEFTEV